MSHSPPSRPVGGVSSGPADTSGVDRVRRATSGWAVAPLLAGLLVAAAAHAGPSDRSGPSEVPPLVAARAVARPSPPVVEALGALERAAAPADYVALRQLWRAADRVDPTEIAEALAAVAADGRAPAPRRAYAGVLEAAALRWRGDLAGSRRAVRELGYVTDWMVLGPFDNEAKAGLAIPSGPELGLHEPLVLDQAFDGRRGPVRWRAAPSPSFVWLDFGALLRPRSYVCGWATTFVRPTDTADRETGDRAIALWVGASGAFRLYWDTELVAWDESYRGLDPDRIAVRVPLGTETHRLTVKACGDEGSTSIAVRLAELDGSPARSVAVEATVRASLEAASHMRAGRAPVSAEPVPPEGPGSNPPAGGPPVPASSGAQAAPTEGAKEGLGEFGPLTPGRGAAPGALQRCATLLRDEPKDAHVAEQIARYLLLTNGAPTGSHVARDLARRAAESEPTVDRLLLAGRLAEDRNGLRAWVDRAESMATDARQRIEVLRARAALARSGTNPQEAVRIYDQILTLEPFDVEATVGKAEFYADAGLGRTALTMLEHASAVRPRAVSLLRALSAQLRGLGRDTQAAEIESRHAALRFDDAGYLQLQVDLAAARADGAGVDHWGKRLLEVDPTSTWALGVVARARRAVGDTDGALAAYDAALQVAPDDSTTLRALADVRAELGQRDEQLRLLEHLLRVEPQDKDVRAYVDALRPAEDTADEKMAWSPEKFLALRDEPAPGAERRTLRRLQVTTMLPNGLARRFFQVVFQPLTSEAAAAARQYAFPFHADRQVVEIDTAKVYRADGRVDEALEVGTAAADEPALRMYTLQRIYYVQFPRLEAGDVVELRYRVEDVSSPDVLGESFGESALLQGPDATLDSEYVVIAPRETHLEIAAARAPGLERSVRDAGTHRIYRLHVRNLPAVRPEPSMPPWPELLASAQLSTFRSWQDVVQTYWGLARDQLDVDDEVRRRTQQLTAGLTSERDKVMAVYHFAANEIRYVGIEFGIEGIRPRRAALTLARGWGDCKDKATLIVSMLRELGIDAELVLVRTNYRGRLSDPLPSLTAFDHAIVFVPSLDLYLDGTAEQTGAGELPSADRGALALRINASGGELVHLPDPEASQSVEHRRLELRLRPNGDLEVMGRFDARGALAPGWRLRYAAESARAERIERDLASLLGPVDLGKQATDLRFEGLDDPEQPVRVHARVKARARSEDDGWSVPMGAAERLVAEYGSLGRRAHALLLGAQRERVETWTLEIPPGTQVRSLPQTVRLESPFGQYVRTVEQTAGRIEVTSTVSLRRSRIEPNEYDAWRSFISEVDRASAPRAVVGK